VLHSRVHEAWALATGTQLETRPATPHHLLRDLPVPAPQRRTAGSDRGGRRELVRLRDGWLNPPASIPSS